jgi:hypothetical protein
MAKEIVLTHSNRKIYLGGMVMGENKATNNITTDAYEKELVITRTFDAPLELVFKAWTEAEHLKHWWGLKASR